MQVETMVFSFVEGDQYTYSFENNIAVSVPKGKTKWFKEIIARDINALRNHNQECRNKAKALRKEAGDFKSLNQASSLITEKNREILLEVFRIEGKIVEIDIECVIRNAIKENDLDQYQSFITFLDIDSDNIDKPDADIFY